MSSWRDNDNFDHSSAFNDKVGMILGGMPTTDDVAPSAVFIAAYLLLLIPVVWRMKTHTLTFGQLWKPVFLILMHITTFALRIQLSVDSVWNKHIFITELIFLRLGPIILTIALLQHLANALLPYIPTIDSPNLPIKIALKYFVLLLTILTHFCLGLTIAVAFDVKQAINGNVEARIKLHRSKEISIWLLCAINISVYFLAVVPLVLLKKGMYVRHLVVSNARERTKFISIIAVCTFIMVVSGFKAAQLAAHGMSSHYVTVINMKVLFYTVCCSGEFIACALLLALAWARIAPPPELLEAYCRLHNDTGHPSANRWPAPPRDLSPPDMAQCNSQQATSRTNISDGQEPAYYDPEVPKGTVRQAKVVSVTVHDGIQQQHTEIDTVRGTASEWSDVNLSGGAIIRPSATLGRNATQDTSGSTSVKQRGSRRTSATSLSTISEDCIEKEDACTVTMSVGNETYMTCYSPNSTLRADPYGRNSSVDSIALPANLIPFHPDPKAVSIATSRLPRALTSTPTSTPTESKPMEGLPIVSTSTIDSAQGQHQPLTMIETNTVQLERAETQMRTPLRASTFADVVSASGGQAGTVSDVAKNPTVSAMTVDMPLASSCSIQSRWSDDSDDDPAHPHSSPSSTHGRFHHHHHHHRHRHRRPLTAECWDHEDAEMEDRTYGMVNVVV